MYKFIIMVLCIFGIDIIYTCFICYKIVWRGEADVLYWSYCFWIAGLDDQRVSCDIRTNTVFIWGLREIQRFSLNFQNWNNRQKKIQIQFFFFSWLSLQYLHFCYYLFKKNWKIRIYSKYGILCLLVPLISWIRSTGKLIF